MKRGRENGKRKKGKRKGRGRERESEKSRSRMGRNFSDATSLLSFFLIKQRKKKSYLIKREDFCKTGT